MKHHPLNCILSPDVLRSVAEHAAPEELRKILQTLELDQTFRLMRAEIVARQDPLVARAIAIAPAGAPHRTIYDQQHSQHTAPGKLARAEGHPAVSDESVNAAYDNFGLTFEFYWEVFARNSIDGHGMPLAGLVHYGTDYDNAFWDGDGHMFFGDGDGKLLTDTTKGLDVIGHELAHGVTQSEANLLYSGQAGALNESVSDVFGSLVQQYHLDQTAQQADWLIGTDIVGPVLTPALRSMRAPGSANSHDNQPSDMDHYVHTASDNGGVHTNSGIPNHAFYVVATTLKGPAWRAAGTIWYDTVTNPRLKPDASFSSFAAVTLDQARIRYGTTSAEADAVTDGWEAVKVPVR